MTAQPAPELHACVQRWSDLLSPALTSWAAVPDAMLLDFMGAAARDLLLVHGPALPQRARSVLAAAVDPQALPVRWSIATPDGGSVDVEVEVDAPTPSAPVPVVGIPPAGPRVRDLTVAAARSLFDQVEASLVRSDRASDADQTLAVAVACAVLAEHPPGEASCWNRPSAPTEPGLVVRVRSLPSPSLPPPSPRPTPGP